MPLQEELFQPLCIHSNCHPIYSPVISILNQLLLFDWLLTAFFTQSTKRYVSHPFSPNQAQVAYSNSEKKFSSVSVCLVFPEKLFSALEANGMVVRKFLMAGCTHTYSWKQTFLFCIQICRNGARLPQQAAFFVQKHWEETQQDSSVAMIVVYAELRISAPVNLQSYSPQDRIAVKRYLF